ncbi:uncharacterized protein [Hoplias malabaricus]|uniref:uncharacterized protein n=1 Tax=Hoplias malabaricus TaxID=27720 RepID=UPI003461F77B
MSAVILQVGQCGNQLGLEWWRLITNKPSRRKKRCPFSSRNGQLSAVCVDTEPKVLRQAQEFVKNNKFRQSNIIEGKGGRGGNWAFGYHGGPAKCETGLLDQTMEAVRQEAERQDYYGGTVLFHSLSGGTGSGLGSMLCEKIRDAFPTSHFLSVSVVPHQSGESPLQHYNTLLSLSSLHGCADGVLLFYNDQALSRRRLSTRSSDTLSDMNSNIVSSLAGLLLPVQSLTTRSGWSLGSEPWELIRSVCPVPSAKLLYTTQNSSSERLHWDSLVGGTLQSLPQLSPVGKHYSSRALLAVARGDEDVSFISSKVLQRLKQGHGCVQWNPFPVDHWTDPLNDLGDSPSSRLLTVCSNHSSVSGLLNRVLQHSTEMLRARVYLHWYQ